MICRLPRLKTSGHGEGQLGSILTTKDFYKGYHAHLMIWLSVFVCRMYTIRIFNPLDPWGSTGATFDFRRFSTLTKQQKKRKENKRVVLTESCHYFVHPANTFPTWCTLNN